MTIIVRVTDDIDTSNENYKLLLNRIQLIAPAERIVIQSREKFSSQQDNSDKLIERHKSMYKGVQHLLSFLEQGTIISSYVKAQLIIENYYEQFLKKLEKIKENNTISTEEDIKKYSDELAEVYLSIAKALVILLEEYKAPEESGFGRDIIPLWDSNTPYSDKMKRVIQLMDRAEEFHLASSPRDIIVTIGQSPQKEDQTYFALVDKPVNTFKPEYQGTVNPVIHELTLRTRKADPPNWFKNQPEIYKQMISTWSSTCLVPSDNIYTLSSRTQIVPGMRNMLEHYLITCDGKETDLEKKLLVSQTFRSSHIAGRANGTEPFVTEDDLKYMAKLGYDAMKMTLEESANLDTFSYPAILYQTLVTPVKGREEDSFVDAVKEEIVEADRSTSKVDIISTNIAVNALQAVAAVGGIIHNNQNEQEQKLINYAKESEDPFVQGMLKEYQLILQAGNKAAIADALNKQGFSLHRAAVEEVLARSIPGVISVGGCMSGKDRKGLELLYADALILFYQQTRKIFSLQNGEPADLALFNSILIQLFNSGHMQKVAGANAPGAEGLKELKHNAPGSIRDHIGTGIQNALGNLNTLAGIVKNYNKRHRKKQDITSSKDPWATVDTSHIKTLSVVESEISNYKKYKKNFVLHPQDGIMKLFYINENAKAYPIPIENLQAFLKACNQDWQPYQVEISPEVKVFFLPEESLYQQIGLTWVPFKEQAKKLQKGLIDELFALDKRFGIKKESSYEALHIEKANGIRRTIYCSPALHSLITALLETFEQVQKGDDKKATEALKNFLSAWLKYPAISKTEEKFLTKLMQKYTLPLPPLFDYLLQNNNFLNVLNSKQEMASILILNPSPQKKGLHSYTCQYYDSNNEIKRIEYYCTSQLKKIFEQYDECLKGILNKDTRPVELFMKIKYEDVKFSVSQLMFFNSPKLAMESEILKTLQEHLKIYVNDTLNARPVKIQDRQTKAKFDSGNTIPSDDDPVVDGDNNPTLKLF